MPSVQGVAIVIQAKQIVIQMKQNWPNKQTKKPWKNRMHYDYVTEENILLRCIMGWPTVIYCLCIQGVLELPTKCPDGTCDGCK